MRGRAAAGPCLRIVGGRAGRTAPRCMRPRQPRVSATAVQREGSGGVRDGAMIDEIELGRVLDEREALVHVDNADEGVPLQDLRELFVCTSVSCYSSSAILGSLTIVFPFHDRHPQVLDRSQVTLRLLDLLHGPRLWGRVRICTG